MGRATALGRIGPTVWWIAAASVLSLAMFGAMGWHVFNTFDVGRQLEAESARFEELRNRLCQLHQELTTNAVMVVASGDPRSEGRQLSLADALGALIDGARARAPAASDVDTLWELHDTQQEVRAIEARAFAMAKQGDTATALALLSGAEYESLQERFSRSAARFVEDYRGRLDDRLRAERDRELVSLLVAFVIFIVTLGIWLVLMVQLRRRERALVAEAAERERADRALQRREAVLAQAQEIAQLGSFERDARTGGEQWSDEFYRILGYAPGAFPPSQPLFFERVHRDDLTRLKRVTESAAASTAGYALEARIVRPSGEERSVSLRAKLERDSDGVVIRTVGTLYDATEQKQIEARVEQSRQQLRSLAAHLLSVREQERAAVAKEIHDEVGQIVAAVRMDLAAVQRKLGAANSKERERLEHTIGLLGGVVETVQRVMSELHPPVLDGVGLAAAIDWQLGQFQKRTGIQCELLGETEAGDLAAEKSLALFRVVQEALSNVAEHARATAVSVRLTRDEGWLALEITDNGRGISEADIRGQYAFGLMGIRERVRVVGGEVQFRGAEGGGTTVEVRMPIAGKLAGSAIPLAP